MSYCPEAGTKLPENHGIHIFLEKPICIPVFGQAGRLGRGVKSLNISASFLHASPWRLMVRSTFPCSCPVSSLIPALPINHSWRHPVSRPGRKDPKSSQRVSQALLALFPTFTAAPCGSRGASRAYLHLPALPPACHSLPASGGERNPAGPTGKLPHGGRHGRGCNRAAAGISRPFRPGRLRGRAISSCEAGEASGSRRP